MTFRIATEHNRNAGWPNRFFFRLRWVSNLQSERKLFAHPWLTYAPLRQLMNSVGIGTCDKQYFRYQTRSPYDFFFRISVTYNKLKCCWRNTVWVMACRSFDPANGMKALRNRILLKINLWQTLKLPIMMGGGVEAKHHDGGAWGFLIRCGVCVGIVLMNRILQFAAFSN